MGSHLGWRTRPDLFVLAFLSALFLALGFVRAWHLWHTGVIIGDEPGYIYSAWQRETANILVGVRSVFASSNIVLFDILELRNIDRVALALPFYLSLWSITSLVVLRLILKALGYSEKTRALGILFLAGIPAFFYPSFGLFTEGMALAFASLGIYLLIRHLNTGRLPLALMAALFFWLAMRSREPYSIIFLLIFAFPLVKGIIDKSARRRLILASLALLVVVTSTVIIFEDPVANLGVASFQRAVDKVIEVTRPTFVTLSHVPVSMVEPLKPEEPPGVDQRKVPDDGGMKAIEKPDIAKSMTSPTRTGGVLSFIGIPYVPEGSIDRIFLMTFLTLLTGYGPIFPLMVIGVSYVLYHWVLRREFRKWLITVMLVSTLLGTMGGVVLVFADSPELLGVRHYSFLMRWANPSVLALPIVAAPMLERITRSRRRTMIVVLSFAVLYAGSFTLTLQAATTMLNPEYETPLSIEPPPARQFGIFLRDYVINNAGQSPFIVLSAPEVPLVWAVPGLSARPDLDIYPYEYADQLLAKQIDRFYIFVPPNSLLSLKETHPLVWQLVSNALNDQSAIKNDFGETDLIFNNEMGVFIAVSTATTG